MQRRDLLRLLGGVSVLGGLAPAELFAVGRETHRRIELERSPLGFFDTHQMHTVAAAGERILPATDTPGAMAARCHRFTELIVADRYDLPRQRRFFSGLIDLDRRASSSTGHLFIDCAAPAQDATLGALEERKEGLAEAAIEKASIVAGNALERMRGCTPSAPAS